MKIVFLTRLPTLARGWNIFTPINQNIWGWNERYNFIEMIIEMNEDECRMFPHTADSPDDK